MIEFKGLSIEDNNNNSTIEMIKLAHLKLLLSFVTISNLELIEIKHIIHELETKINEGK